VSLEAVGPLVIVVCELLSPSEPTTAVSPDTETANPNSNPLWAFAALRYACSVVKGLQTSCARLYPAAHAVQIWSLAVVHVSVMQPARVAHGPQLRSAVALQAAVSYVPPAQAPEHEVQTRSAVAEQAALW
jgi:hypothetical protein